MRLDFIEFACSFIDAIVDQFGEAIGHKKTDEYELLKAKDHALNVITRLVATSSSFFICVHLWRITRSKVVGPQMNTDG
ncbi:hypothetical protein Pan14r_09180 [Crateriforma conspicua]|uniref:Uncharacterized protein n=1 Tax=Crateriforma conspicua TaxID=2527996 RepID=A0A5C5Y204_9PLAN|nr:hypothetical protein Pan14r_09180 [Crateriforma conspicua]